MTTKALTVALAGNPNCGKTALFNQLTGSRQRVGNWSGVTVDRKSGFFMHRGQQITVVDLPGIYAISVNDDGAIDEQIACRFLSTGDVDLVVNVLDGSNLVRNLYLTLQLLELGVPVILAVNMMDIVKARGLQIDLDKLRKLTGCAVVPLVASQSQGIAALKNTIATFTPPSSATTFSLPLEPVLQQHVEHLAGCIEKHLDVSSQKAYWLALRLLEEDHCAIDQVDAASLCEARLQRHSLEEKLAEEADILIADARYRMAVQLSDAVLSLVGKPRSYFTERIDRIVLNRFAGVPIFFLVMYAMFFFSINVGGAFQDFFDIATETIFIGGLSHLLTQWHFPVWLIALLANGFGQGINTVVTFIPVIGAMFLFLALLEDCGYMARAAFVMDRCMRLLGLPGKSFVPMIVGFGCNVPAVMGTRSLSGMRDRILTVVMVPFMSCGARLAIFSVFASAFFPQHGALVIFLLYLAGILVAILSGLMLRRTVLSGEPAPLLMELPPYHVPRIGALMRHAWQRLRGFLLRAGKYIVPICVLIGVLNSVSVNGRLIEGGAPDALLSQVGRTVTPIFAPMGLQQDNWPATVGLITGILAKEVVIGTLNSLYSQPQQQQASIASFDFFGGLRQALLSVPRNFGALGANLMNPLLASQADEMSGSAYGVMVKRFEGKIGAFAYLLFVLLYFPCVSTLATMRREIGASWAYFSVTWSTVLAYVLAVIVWQFATLMQHPFFSLYWILAMLLLVSSAFWGLRHYAARSSSEQKVSARRGVSDVT